MLFMITLVACDQQVYSQNHSGKAKTIEKKAYIKGDAPPIETETLDIPLINQMDHPRLYNGCEVASLAIDRKSTRLNSSHVAISYAVFCLKKKKKKNTEYTNKPNTRRHELSNQQ